MYTIIIPCHNDCKNAERLKKVIKGFSKNKVIIGHNSCKSAKSFAWANKAKTINSIVSHVTTKYVVIFDADINLSANLINSFENAMQKNVRFGSCIVAQKDAFGKISNIFYQDVYCGAAWFIKSDIIKSIKIPENCVTEDTAYVKILNNKNIKARIMDDSILTVSLFEKSFKKKFNQNARYCLGGLQLLFRGIHYSDGIAVLIMSLFAVYLLFFKFTIYWKFMIFFFIIYFVQFIHHFHKKKRWFFQYFVDYLSMTGIIPIYSMYLFIIRKQVW